MTRGKAYKALMSRITEALIARNADTVAAICINPMTMADATGEPVFAYMNDNPPIRKYRGHPIHYMSEIPQGDFVISSETWAQAQGWTLYTGHSFGSASFTNSKTWTVPYPNATSSGGTITFKDPWVSLKDIEATLTSNGVIKFTYSLDEE